MLNVSVGTFVVFWLKIPSCRTSVKCCPTWYYQRLNLAQVIFSHITLFWYLFVLFVNREQRHAKFAVSNHIAEGQLWSKVNIIIEAHLQFQGQSDALSEKSLWAPSSSPAWVKVLQSLHCQIYVSAKSHSNVWNTGVHCIHCVQIYK